MIPFSYSRAATNLAWQDAYSTKHPQTKEFLVKPAKAGGTTGQVHQPFNEMPNTFTMSFEDSSGLCISKGIPAKTIRSGHFISFLLTQPTYGFTLDLSWNSYFSCENIIHFAILVPNSITESLRVHIVTSIKFPIQLLNELVRWSEEHIHSSKL